MRYLIFLATFLIGLMFLGYTASATTIDDIGNFLSNMLFPSSVPSSQGSILPASSCISQGGTCKDQCSSGETQIGSCRVGAGADREISPCCKPTTTTVPSTTTINCVPVCKNIGTKSEGLYDSCTGNLIRYENCASTTTTVPTCQIACPQLCSTCHPGYDGGGCYTPNSKTCTCNPPKPCIPRCSYGTADASNPVSYGSYNVFAVLGSMSEWARIVVKDSRGNTIDTEIINQGDSRDIQSVGLTVKVVGVRALQDGTIVGADLAVSSIGIFCPGTTTTVTTSKIQLVCPKCDDDSCGCRINNCNSGTLSIYSDSTCSGIPFSEQSFSESTLISPRLSAGTYYGKVYCDDSRVSSCQSMNVTHTKPRCPYQCCNADDSIYQHKPCPIRECPACNPDVVPGCINTCQSLVCQNHQCVNLNAVGHDVGATSIFFPSLTGYPKAGEPFQINGTIVNVGNYSENVSATLKACPSYWTGTTGLGNQASTDAAMVGENAGGTVVTPCIFLDSYNLTLSPGQVGLVSSMASLPVGEYNIVLSASIPYDQNPSNNYITYQGLTVTGTSPMFNLTFKEGWNMMSYPVYSAQNISTDCTIVSAWRYENGRYIQGKEIIPAFGYWLKSSNNCTMNFSGTPVSVNLPFSWYQRKGWNLIGSFAEVTQFSNIKGNCQILSGPWWYDSSSNGYAKEINIEPGKGYFIKVNASCSLTSLMPPTPP